MSKNLYLIAGILLVVYFGIMLYNRKKNKNRDNRGFLEGKKREDRKQE